MCLYVACVCVHDHMHIEKKRSLIKFLLLSQVEKEYLCIG